MKECIGAEGFSGAKRCVGTTGCCFYTGRSTANGCSATNGRSLFPAGRSDKERERSQEEHHLDKELEHLWDTDNGLGATDCEKCSELSHLLHDGCGLPDGSLNLLLNNGGDWSLSDTSLFNGRDSSENLHWRPRAGLDLLNWMKDNEHQTHLSNGCLSSKPGTSQVQLRG